MSTWAGCKLSTCLKLVHGQDECLIWGALLRVKNRKKKTTTSFWVRWLACTETSSLFYINNLWPLPRNFHCSFFFSRADFESFFRGVRSLSFFLWTFTLKTPFHSLWKVDQTVRSESEEPSKRLGERSMVEIPSGCLRLIYRLRS